MREAGADARVSRRVMGERRTSDRAGRGSFAAQTHDRFHFDEQMKLPKFARNYADARAEVDAIDKFVCALDAAQENSGLMKTELATAIDARQEAVRRLFTTKKPNPTPRPSSVWLRPWEIELNLFARPKQEWRLASSQKGMKINLITHSANIRDRESRPEAGASITQMSATFHAALAPRLAQPGPSVG